MERHEDGDLILYTAGPVGFGNNIYLVVDRATGESAFVDAPGKAEELAAVAAEAGARPSMILLTHSHPDHTSCIDDLKKRYGCKVYGDAAEPWLKEGQLDVAVTHNETVRVGGLVFRTISNPGHTPGSTTFLWGKHAFVGDTLFPGGPGASRSNEALKEEVASITTRLYALPNDTVVWPGHGANTTIGASKAEYAVFAARPWNPDLKGDVAWLTS
jgi:glyoxylase-like metal-dependent hydrolase (beta-lactamase superfamily II)